MTVLGEVLAIVRLAFTMRLDSRRFVGRDSTIALLGATALTLWMTLDWFRFDEPVRLNLSGLPDLAALAAAAVGLSWLMARVSDPPIPIRQTLLLVAGYLPAVAAGGWVLTAPIARTTFIIVAAVLIVHAALYFFFGLRALAGAPPWRAFSALAVSVTGIIALGSEVYLHPGVWSLRQSPDEIADYLESERRTEQLMYAQRERIDRALAGFVAPQGTVPKVYFVGFAGFGDQKVFAEEIALAARRIDERYGTGGRRLLLINDRRDFDTHPLASPSALSHAIQGVAARMNREHDVLFLALSSHGKKDPYLVVENGALPLDALTGETLARILRESQIRWKVLVISACYAGAFIPPLRNEHTVIIAASAPDKTSFGCNDRRELTYFGEAFYRDALPNAASLRAAFETASADIAARERAEGLVPSEPRAHFGEAIEVKLAELESRRVNSGKTAQ